MNTPEDRLGFRLDLCGDIRCMTAFPPRTDIRRHTSNVRFVPFADSRTAANEVHKTECTIRYLRNFCARTARRSLSEHLRAGWNVPNLRWSLPCARESVVA